MYSRVLELSSILDRKSVFLFGPRQTGKTTWLKTHFPNALYINLLSKKVFDDYLNRSNALESDIEIYLRNPDHSNIVIIDEIQKLPSLLDEVHNQIELNKKLRFILTGSSARKLKRTGANLLGGRASWRNLFPLVYPELKNELNSIGQLERRILLGGLPAIFNSTKPFDDLQDYLQIYLNEEIKSEGLVRKYENFHRFLTVAALSNSKQINFTQIGNDAQTAPRTIHDYFQILEDTLIGFMLPAFTETLSRKAMTSAKFYFFDTGVSNAILGRQSLKMSTPEFGEIFEQFIVSEVRAFISYTGSKAEMFYWRSTSKIEVDLIIKLKEEIYAIEIKSKNHPTTKDYSGLMAFKEDFPKAKTWVVTPEARHQIDHQKAEIFPVYQFLDLLWSGKLI